MSRKKEVKIIQLTEWVPDWDPFPEKIMKQVKKDKKRVAYIKRQKEGKEWLKALFVDDLTPKKRVY